MSTEAASTPATHGESPVQVDLFRLAGATMPELVTAFDAAMDRPLEAEARHIPSMVSQLAELVLCRAVSVIRTGDSLQTLNAATALSHSVRRRYKKVEKTGQALEGIFESAYDRQRVASTIMSRAASPYGEGSEYPILRSGVGAAAKVISLLLDAPENRMVTQKVYQELNGYAPDQGWHLLCGMQSAGLVISDWPFSDLNAVHLGPKVRPNNASAEVLALVRFHAERFDTHVQESATAETETT